MIKKIVKLILVFTILTVFICGCGVVQGSVTPKQIIDSEDVIIGYYISGEITEEAIPTMILTFQNGKGTVYRGGTETLKELEQLGDDEILEQIKDREHYEGETSIWLYTEFWTNDVLMEQIDLAIENGISYNVVSWAIDVEHVDYWKEGVSFGESTYYGYNLLNGDGVTAEYLFFRIDAENFTLGLDSSKTPDIKNEVVGGL